MQKGKKACSRGFFGGSSGEGSKKRKRRRTLVFGRENSNFFEKKKEERRRKKRDALDKREGRLFLRKKCMHKKDPGKKGRGFSQKPSASTSHILGGLESG
ncbi:hypothetical protein VNO77_20098 [Canavalia gladiata]|uniref:Uncharacterized protein n=1 Tax=Canavalia gladiata TaxID=3824 RepID=A0AAN9LSL4_CANGL